MEEVNRGLEAVKSDTTRAGETVHVGISLTKEALGSLAAFFQGLTKSAELIPSDEDVQKMKKGTETATNAYLEAYGILYAASATTQNGNLKHAATMAKGAISILAPADETRFAAEQSARADAVELEETIGKIRGMYTELLTLAGETFNIANFELGGVALTAASEGEQAIVEISAYQQEKIN